MNGRDGICRPPAAGAATAAPRATRLGKDEGDEDHRDRDGDAAGPARDPAGACRWLAERATPWRTSARTLPAGSRAVRPSGRSSNEPSPRRRGQTARAHCPGVPDRPRRTCGGVPAGSAQMPVARCAPRARRHEGSRWSTGGASHLRRRAPHRWRRNHHRDQRREAATTGIRGAPVSAEMLWPEGPGTAITARRFTRDNWNYRAQKSVSRHVGTARVYHAVTRIRNHRRS